MLSNSCLGINTTSPTERLQVSGKIYSDMQFLNNSNDSVTAPAFSFKEDSNTGMFHPSNDAIGFTTNGTEKLRIDTSGNVGIGTTSPSSRLHITPSSGTDPSTNGIYVYNPNTTSTSHAIICARTNSASGGNPFYSLDIGGVAGWSMGISNADSDKLVIKKTWDFSGDNAIMTFMSSGNVGIATTSPSYILDVAGNTRINNTVIGDAGHGVTWASFAHSSMFTSTGYAMIQSSSGETYINCASTKDIRFRIANADQGAWNATGLGIGTTSPSYKLHVSGEIYATGDITAFSDIRVKSNITRIVNPLEKLQQISGYTYDMPDIETSLTKITPRYSGLIAQEVEQILPEVVHKSDDGKLSIAYGNLAGLFVESIKELKKENNDIKIENQALKSKLNDIETKLARMESLLSQIVVNQQ
jgi:hypothetical protein